MRERLELIIEELKQTLSDVDKVESGTYGFKAAAPRVRKSALSAIKRKFKKRKNPILILDMVTISCYNTLCVCSLLTVE